MPLAPSGALEAATCVNVINRGVIPPTINQEHPDPTCDLDYVPNQARMRTVQYGDVQLVRVRRPELRADLQTVR